MTNSRRVYLVDDDHAVRTSLGELLTVCGFTVRTFPSGRALLDAVRSLEEGCVLLDLRMPELSGLEVQAELERLGVALPVIFLTAHGDVPTGVSAMKRGALDFLTKPVRDSVLLEALAHGFAHLDRITAERRAARDAQARFDSLTGREREVVELVVSGLRNREIAQRLAIALPTVKVHRMRGMAKLRVDTVPHLMRVWREARGAH